MKKYLFGTGTIVLACAILLVSVFRSASVNYVFATPNPKPFEVLGERTQNIFYPLPYPGTILPDSPVWPVKALRDKVWYLLNANHLKKAELALLFSDKRLSMSEILFQNKKSDVAVATLSKGEKYLEVAVSEELLARKEGMETGSFLIKMANAALKHRELIEEELMPLAPEDAKPEVVKAGDYAKNAYKSARDGLNNLGLSVPETPFSGD